MANVGLLLSKNTANSEISTTCQTYFKYHGKLNVGMKVAMAEFAMSSCHGQNLYEFLTWQNSGVIAMAKFRSSCHGSICYE